MKVLKNNKGATMIEFLIIFPLVLTFFLLMEGLIMQYKNEATYDGIAEKLINAAIMEDSLSSARDEMHSMATDEFLDGATFDLNDVNVYDISDLENPCSNESACWKVGNVIEIKLTYSSDNIKVQSWWTDDTLVIKKRMVIENDSK